MMGQVFTFRSGCQAVQVSLQGFWGNVGGCLTQCSWLSHSADAHGGCEPAARAEEPGVLQGRAGGRDLRGACGNALCLVRSGRTCAVCSPAARQGEGTSLSSL